MGPVHAVTVLAPHFFETAAHPLRGGARQIAVAPIMDAEDGDPGWRVLRAGAVRPCIFPFALPDAQVLGG